MLHGRGTFSTSNVGGWRLAVGGSWWLAVGGWWSLRAVLKGWPQQKNKKKAMASEGQPCLLDISAVGVCWSMVRVNHCLASVSLACRASYNQVATSICGCFSPGFSPVLAKHPYGCSNLTSEVPCCPSWLATGGNELCDTAFWQGCP